MLLPLEISHEIDTFFAPHVEENPYDYVCIYGSSVYAPEKPTADVDIFVVTHTPGSIALDSLVGFIKDLHARHGRQLDAEVPYENKVLYTSHEISSAVQFEGFNVSEDEITVPPIRKEPSFLAGTAIKARLALNGLTSPHAALGKNFSRYQAARKMAGEAVTLLAISLCDDEEFTVSDLHNSLSMDRETGATGEMFLGYKMEYPIVSEHVLGVLHMALETFETDGIVYATSAGYTVRKNAFHPTRYMQDAVSAHKDVFL